MSTSRGIHPTFQRLHLSVLTNSGFTPKQLHAIATYFRVPYRAMLNRYMELGEPLHVEQTWTLATAARLPDPETSHQVGIAVLPMTFQHYEPGQALYPTSPIVLFDMLLQRHKPSRAITNAPAYRAAMEMIEAIVIQTDNQLREHRHELVANDMTILTLPSITLAAYTASSHPILHVHQPLRKPKRPRRLHEASFYQKLTNAA